MIMTTKEMDRRDIYTAEHQEILRKMLVSNDQGLNRKKMLALLLISTYRFQDSRDKIVSKLRDTSDLSNEKELVQLLNGLVRENLLTVHHNNKQKILSQSTDNYRSFLTLFPEQRKEISKLRKKLCSPNPSMGTLDRSEEATQRRAFLQTAEKRIFLYCLNTDVQKDEVALLKEKAKNGVKVRVLLAHPRLADQIRSPKMGLVKQWAKALDLKRHRNIRLRTYNRKEDIVLYNSMLVDKQVYLRVFNPQKQVADEGTIHYTVPDKLDSNLSLIISDRFYETWHRAVPYRWHRLFWWFWNRYIALAAAIALLLWLGPKIPWEPGRDVATALMVGAVGSLITLGWEALVKWHSRRWGRLDS